MSSPTEPSQAQPQPLGPARDFKRFCDEEFERRQNSDDAFDEALFVEARDLVIRRLRRSAAQPEGKDS